jgi:hypothetical protein
MSKNGWQIRAVNEQIKRCGYGACGSADDTPNDPGQAVGSGGGDYVSAIITDPMYGSGGRQGRPLFDQWRVGLETLAEREGFDTPAGEDIVYGLLAVSDRMLSWVENQRSRIITFDDVTRQALDELGAHATIGPFLMGVLTFRSAAARGSTPCYGGPECVCFAAGTLVQTERGLIKIEEVRAGDRVWSRIADRGWVSARKLEPGDELFTSRGGWLRVSNGTWTNRTTAVYNLEVEAFHTYFVGEVGAWVHNTCLGDIPWSNSSVRRAAGQLDRGAREVYVGSRAEAEELFLGRYQGAGYRNTTGMSGREAREFFGTKAGTYHWDTGAGAYPHDAPHLQVHTHGGSVVRIYFPE